MTRNKWLLILLIVLGLVLAGCGLQEGTIVYDVDFPRADSDEAQGGGYDPDNLSCSPSYTPDTDSTLLVYYDFDNSSGEGLHDKSPANGRTASASAWPYDLTNVTSWKSVSVSGSIKYAQGCAYGQAAYFDSTTGYLVNENFDNASISALNDNYTVSMWLYPETSSDPSKSRHAILSGYDSSGPDFQLEHREITSVFEWNAVGEIKNNLYPANQWYHVALVKHDNGTGSLYVNGA